MNIHRTFFLHLIFFIPSPFNFFLSWSWSFSQYFQERFFFFFLDRKEKFCCQVNRKLEYPTPTWIFLRFSFFYRSKILVASGWGWRFKAQFISYLFKFLRLECCWGWFSCRCGESRKFGIHTFYLNLSFCPSWLAQKNICFYYSWVLSRCYLSYKRISPWFLLYCG